jgi:GNAT superfamily N-acetyltransferase
MELLTYHREGYTITTDRKRMDLAAIHRYLSQESYWAQGRTIETVKRSMENSLCYGLFAGEAQAGFARVVTDFATFAWLCDLFILGSHRGRGLGKWLVQCIVEHPDLGHILRFMLATQDAHELYRRQGGFTEIGHPEWLMQRHLVPPTGV